MVTRDRGTRCAYPRGEAPLLLERCPKSSCPGKPASHFFFNPCRRTKRVFAKPLIIRQPHPILQFFRKQSALRKYRRDLGAHLRLQHGQRLYYSTEQVRDGVSQLHLTAGPVAFAYAMDCDAGNFDSWQQAAGGPEEDTALRAVIAEKATRSAWGEGAGGASDYQANGADAGWGYGGPGDSGSGGSGGCDGSGGFDGGGGQ